MFRLGNPELNLHVVLLMGRGVVEMSLAKPQTPTQEPVRFASSTNSQSNWLPQQTLGIQSPSENGNGT